MSEVEPLSALEIARLRMEHVREEVVGGEPGDEPEPWCFMCSDSWPCDTARLLATLDAERARADEAVALLREMDAQGVVRRSLVCVDREASETVNALPERRAICLRLVEKFAGLSQRLDALLREGKESKS